ncbi:MAG: Aminotransferase class-III [Cenarchaeum symbiont of Oopsacas minuta]|nr:Aminotransferase class-III [Cenarchaeum symbiont of Oopsacas minuta]
MAINDIEHLDAVIKYRKKTPRSARAFSKSQKYHVNGVHHNIRYFEPYPFATRSASGSKLTDVDLNKYTDYWMGHWSLILGHTKTSIVRAMSEQLQHGWMYGTVNEQTLDLSESICKTVKAAERIRYVTSGTEATMYAVRLARAITGKKIIVKIDGGWHGYTSELLKSVNWPFKTSESCGLVGSSNIVSIPYNDIEKTQSILRRIGKNLAGVIIEPLLGGGGCIPADPEYMHSVQEFVHKRGALFMLDEIVTGFRFRYGCIYPQMKLDPDIVTLGKIIGGGFPIGAICGKKEIMELSDTNLHSKTERVYIGGGTFSANPATMSAGNTTLKDLKKNKGRIYSKISSLGKEVGRKIAKAFDGKVIVTGKDSMFMPHFKGNLEIHEIKNASDAAKCDTSALSRYHFSLLARSDIFFLPGKLGAISNAHTRSDINALVAATERYAQDTKSMYL